MRLFLLPITTRRTFLYGHRSTPLPTEQASYLDRLTVRAARTWVDWEKRESGWQKKVTQYGNRALQRIAYEEWALKSIPPLNKAARARAQEGKQVPVVFPAHVFEESGVVGVLRKWATERRELHRKRMWWSFVLMPFTAPFMIVPIMPNIPFFYVAFRAWSHWRAYSGSLHLSFLLDENLVKPQSTSQLEATYPVDSAASKFDDNGTVPEKAVLELKEAKEVAEILKVPELAPELERAVAQAGDALNAEKAEKAEGETKKIQ